MILAHRSINHNAKIDVIIVAFNNAVDVAELVADLAEDDMIREIVVIDHGDGSAYRMALAEGARAIYNPTNPGFGAGQNLGSSVTGGSYILMLNPDARLLAGALEAGISFLDSNPRVAALQGEIRSLRNGLPERSAGSALGPLHLMGRALALGTLGKSPVVSAVIARFAPLKDWVERAPNTVRSVQSLSATAILVRREAFNEVGGFDEEFFLYGEDLDLSLRLRMAAWQLVSLPIPWADHRDGSTSPDSWQREFRWFEGTILYAARWWGYPSFAFGILATVLEAFKLSVQKPGESLRLFQSLVTRPIVLKIKRTREGSQH